MASFNGYTPADPPIAFGGKSSSPKNGLQLDPDGNAVITYQYRILATGVVATTTDPGSIPSTGVVVLGTFIES